MSPLSLVTERNNHSVGMTLTSNLRVLDKSVGLTETQDRNGVRMKDVRRVYFSLFLQLGISNGLITSSCFINSIIQKASRE